MCPFCHLAGHSLKLGPASLSSQPISAFSSHTTTHQATAAGSLLASFFAAPFSPQVALPYLQTQVPLSHCGLPTRAPASSL